MVGYPVKFAPKLQQLYEGLLPFRRTAVIFFCNALVFLSLIHIFAYMVGREIKEKFPRVTCARGKKILEVRNLNAGRLVRDINLDLYAGEIVGVAGLMGAGRTETCLLYTSIPL